MVFIAETNDYTAHGLSLPYPTTNSIKMLAGSRFPFNANQVYRMPADRWQSVKNQPDAIQEIVRWFVKDHYTNQLPRILTLERYYQGDNNIHYWNSGKSEKRADNRIADGLSRYITNIRVGYQFGNPIKFGYANSTDNKDTGDDLIREIELFNSSNDEVYHEKVMGKNLNNTGRAYELMYIRKGTNSPAMKAIDPANCFVVYDTTVEEHSLFAVRYYAVGFMDQTTYYVEVYTDDKIYYLTADNQPYGEYTLDKELPHYFNAVPISEYKLNDDRMGSWEIKLDELDALDKSISEMANSQEDFSNAILVISGDIDSDDAEPLIDSNGEQMYDKNGNKLYKDNKVNPSSEIMFVKPSIIPDGTGSNTVIPTQAEYLIKELGSEGWEIFNKRLFKDIHKDTNTPDITDDNFASNASGVAMSYKLWGADQERATQESLYTRGLMRRLRLLANYWGYIEEVSNATERIENVQITYTANLPKNDSEIVANLQSLAATDQISSETLHEYAAPVTGVPAEQENERLQKQKETDSGDTLEMLQSTLRKAGVNVDFNGARATTNSTTNQSGQSNGKPDRSTSSTDA